MHAAVLARIEQERELRAAIHDDDLLTHYQPIYDLATRRIIGFEALVRWAHPIGGLVDPRLFVPLAEELGLIGEIDAFVLPFGLPAGADSGRNRDSGATAWS